MSDPNRIIVVLDYPDAASAMALAQRLDPAHCRVKVGKELFTAAGPSVVEALQQRGFDVFLDLKYHDIPNTVAGACRAAAALGVWMVNVHAGGGRAMLAAAREAVDRVPGRKPLLIGVTVLTSLDDAALSEVGIGCGAAAQVERLATLTSDCGLDGVVCSAAEAALVSAATRPGFLKVTPGIRLAGDAKGDQRRVVTPADAIRMGADYLVIGRSITHAADPLAVLEDIRHGLHAR
ncbi:MAG: orotidine-5'-phosphate decarboxylase [Betaproteobacteria bacterium]|nr:orotidine-5'-phosphate decarboxylase [Betaproteobacteria bacterium]